MTDDLNKPLLSILDLNYLRKGDRLRLKKPHVNNYTQVFATVDMDGHSVSKHYGRVNGSTYYDNVETVYINVKFDHIDRYNGTHPNDSIMHKNGWQIFVSSSVMARILADKRTHEESDSRTQAIADAEAAVEQALVALKNAREALDKIKNV